MKNASDAPGRLSALRRELVRKVRQVGIWGTAMHIGSKLVKGGRGLRSSAKKEVDPFDLKYGTDTDGIIGVGSLDIAADQMEHSMHYGPICDDEFTPTLNSLPVVCEDLVFVDLGSGKGRVLLMASLFPFKRIIGVELSRMLHDTAVRNIQIFKDARQICSQIEAVNADASTFEIPQEPTLFFLANPFDDHVMHLVVSHIRDSLKRHPRKIFVWYIKPCYRKALDGADFLRISRDTGRYVFYEGQPTSFS